MQSNISEKKQIKCWIARPDPIALLASAAAFAVALAAYLPRLCPTVAAGDSGELTTACAVAGIPHPPGYPLYTMLGRLFTLLPFGEVAWRVNLFSALCHALTVLLIFWVVYLLTKSIWASWTGALFLGFSRTFWHYAEVAEVFPLNDLFAALLLLLIVMGEVLFLPPILTKVKTYSKGKSRQNAQKTRPDPKKEAGEANQPALRRLVFLIALLMGVGLSNHHTIVLLFPVIAIGLARVWPVLREKKTMLICLLLVLVGLLPYLYLPIAASQNPPLNWDNPRTLSNFARMLLRMDYGSLSLLSKESQKVGASWEHVPIYLSSLYRDFTPWGLLLAALGIVFLFRRERRIAFPLLTGFLLTSVFFQLITNMPVNEKLLLGVMERFYLLPAVIFAIFIGCGAFKVQSLSAQILRRWAPLPAVASALLSLSVVFPYLANREAADFSRNFMARDFGRNILRCLSPGALFFSRGDAVTMNVDYLQMALGERPDVMALDQEKLTYTWYVEQVRRRFPKVVIPGVRYDGTQTLNGTILDANRGRFPIFFLDFKEESYRARYLACPVGLVFKMFLKDEVPPAGRLFAENESLLSQFSMTEYKGSDPSKTTRCQTPSQTPETSFEAVMEDSYALAFFRLAYDAERLGLWKKAVELYRRIIRRYPVYAPPYKNLGILLINKNQKAEALPLWQTYLRLKPDDPDAAAMRAVLKSK